MYASLLPWNASAASSALAKPNALDRTMGTSRAWVVGSGESPACTQSVARAEARASRCAAYESLSWITRRG